MTEDLNTRVTLLERTTVARDELTAREDRLLERLEVLLDRHMARMNEEQSHRFKVFGHEIADQLRGWADKIHTERNAIDDKRDARLRTELPNQPNSYRSFIQRNWVWLGVVGLLIILLRPDLAGAVMQVFI